MRHYVLRSLHLAGCSLVFMSVLRCSSSSSPSGTGGASSVVGTGGGSVTSPDGVLSVSVPAGALPSNVTLTVAPESSPPSGAIGVVYDIGPTGTVFSSPITLTFHYDSVSLGSTEASALRAATYGSGSWQILPGTSVDTTHQTVSGTTTHLSPYAMTAVSAASTCAQVIVTADCSSGTAGGSSGSTGGSSGGGSSGTASGGTSQGVVRPQSCPSAPTCATATNICAGYPGATMTGCTDGADGYTASCCFAAGAPICVALGGGSECSASSGGTGGGTTGSSGTGSSGTSSGTASSGSSSGTTCTTQTCAEASCGNWPGSTLSNCVDSASGFTASCCFAPGTPYCVSAGGGGSSSGSGGTTTQTCPPTSCGPGGTSQCTTTANSFAVTCCYDPGVLPSSGSDSSTTGSGSGTVSGSSGGGSSSGATGSSGGSTSGATGSSGGSTSGATGSSGGSTSGGTGSSGGSTSGGTASSGGSSGGGVDGG